MPKRNRRSNSTQDFSEGIQEYLRTREGPATMASLFGSLENMEEEEGKIFRPRARTWTEGNDKDILLSEEILKRQENMLKKILKSN